MRNFFTNETAIKIVSILVALVMWMYVMNEQNPQVTYVIRDVPVKMINLDQSKFALKDVNQELKVNVKVRGRRSLIAELKPQDINAEVNLRGRIEGDNLLRVDVTVPPNVEFIDVSPKELIVVLDSVIEEQLPITVDVIGRPAVGFAAIKPITKPQAVVVKGPRSMINAIKKVSTKIDITGKNSTFVSTLPVRVLDAQNKEQKDIVFRPDVVEVTVPIVPVKDVTIVPRLSGNPPEGYIINDVRANPPSIRVTADSDVLSNLDTINTETINIQGRTSSLTKNVKLVIPSGVTILEEELAKDVRVSVDIERIASTTLSFSSKEIEVKNLPENLSAELEDKDIILTVNGPESMIDKVNKSIVKIFVDVSDLAEGEHMVKITAEILKPYGVLQIEPGEIKVTLSNL